MTTPRTSLYDDRASTSEGRQSLAAAEAAAQVMNLLEVAKSHSGLSQNRLALELGVTDGRVSQVLSGDGNYHIATVARFLNAMGAKLTLTASTADGRVLRRVRRRESPDNTRMIQSPVIVQWLTSDGLTTSRTAIEHEDGRMLVSVSAAPPSWQTSTDAGHYQQNVEEAVIAETRTRDPR
jgi:DNA-binding phage protein